ncbi:uncharacterized protein BJ212DRAFT_799796 [Suillus subaureus]|uniref:Uncharacterized protein n=1 Tax=Suillus subaureus TaxID=48587 RepID=A0A9P7AMK1_9AGAM|nr:uncharacterized protein BJ212DRAFT_799796 [Suillus subaureus]KAG1792537.1 hypothetical protein BJ212DRAFT_799796 [Suillus subaureus]
MFSPRIRDLSGFYWYLLLIHACICKYWTIVSFQSGPWGPIRTTSPSYTTRLIPEHAHYTYLHGCSGFMSRSLTPFILENYL